jgi:hypothetical protein
MEYIVQGTYWMYGNAVASTPHITFACPKLALKERDRLQTLEEDSKGDEGCTYEVRVEWI